MRKLRCQNELRFPCSRESAGRAAFSLAELVISIGILILMLALAGQVFTITVRSTGQATALTETSQQLRMFEDTLREDLRSVQPGQSLILIQGNPVNAYWTQGGKDADIEPKDPSDGYGHASDPEREDANSNLVAPRADILMIFTSRKSTSYVSPNVTGRLQQVVYGHAELGEYVSKPNPGPAGDLYEFKPDPSGDKSQSAFPVDLTTDYPLVPSSSSPSPIPAAQWHLARRSVLLVPVPKDPNSPLPPIALDATAFLDSQSDLNWNFAYDRIVLQHQLDPGTGAPLGYPWFLPAVFGNVSAPYAEWIKPFRRSWLDPTPPPIYANRLGHYFLPNCASFKVEWSLDPKSSFVAGRLDGTSEVFWFDPGDLGDPSDPSDDDPLRSLATRVKELKKGGTQCGPGDFVCRSLDSLLIDRTAETMYPGGNIHKYSLSDRFRGPSFPGANADLAWSQLAPDGRRPNLEVFTAARPPSVPGSEPVPDDVWPGALRITVDVFDRERRLDRPIRHVIIVPVGG